MPTISTSCSSNFAFSSLNQVNSRIQPDVKALT